MENITRENTTKDTHMTGETLPKPPTPSLTSQATRASRNRIANFAVKNGVQRNIVDIIKPVKDERLNGDELRRELVDSILVEDFTNADVQRHGDLIRRIRATLKDGNIQTDCHTSYTHEVLESASFAQFGKERGKIVASPNWRKRGDSQGCTITLTP